MPDARSALASERRRAAAIAGHSSDVPVLLDLAHDSDASVRATALAALDRCGALDAALLVAGLRDADAGVRRRAATLASGTPDREASVNDVLTLLADDDHLVAEAAAWTLGEWGDDNPRLDDAVGALIAMCTSHDEPLCREAAVAALGAIGDDRGLDAILHACTDKPAIRRRAVLALAPFDGDRVEAAIDTALQDRDWQVRQAAEDLRR
jgi:HEAT repeat protein